MGGVDLHPSVMDLGCLLQAGDKAGGQARPEHLAEGASAQQASEREGQQPGQRALPGHALPPAGRRAEQQAAWKTPVRPRSGQERGTLR